MATPEFCNGGVGRETLKASRHRDRDIA